MLAYGKHAGRDIVLKIAKREHDEWRAGYVLQALADVAPRVIRTEPGAALIDRITPATPLTTLPDDEATQVIADIISRMTNSQPLPDTPTVQSLSTAFEWYHTSGSKRLERELVIRAERVYSELATSQSTTRLLHGDLQHFNVLRDAKRGWLLIDPKGLAGETEYELGAALRNPIDRLDLLLSHDVQRKRVDTYCELLGLKKERVKGWAFAQALLSLIWSVQDGDEIDPWRIELTRVFEELQ
jgi:streptomycin 6-kinase